MRADLRRAAALLAGLVMLAALAAAVNPAAARAAGHDRTFPATGSLVAGGSHAGRMMRAAAGRPRLTADTKAPCNQTPKKKNQVRCLAVVRTPANRVITPDALGPPATALGPSDIQSAYKLPASVGAGRTVAIVDAYGDSSAESDLASFRSYYGLPPCTTANGCFEKVNQAGQQGSYPPDGAGWGVETSLDLDAVSAACPACHIMLVEADTATFGDMGAAEDEAVALGAKYVSDSWGAPEFSGDGDLDKYFNHPGVAITVSSGDNGYSVDYPTSSPYVTSVGGTTLTRDSSASRGWSETAWSGSGSGCSSYEPQPAFQQDIPQLDALCSMRATADISADADPVSGLAVYDTLGGYGWLQVGGTSLSSPLVATMYAMAGVPVTGTYPNTYPYRTAASAALFDITSGSNFASCVNVMCTAGPGWDGPTGLGTPDGVTALSGGPSGDIAGQVTDKSTGKPIADAVVSTSQGYTTDTDTNGKYDMYLPVGTYNISLHAFGYADQAQDGVQVSDGQTTTVSLAMTAVPEQTLSGTVTDGSGHGWPLYARITVADSPLKPIYTDPYTGRYSVKLPEQASYTLDVTPVRFAGYKPATVAVQIGTSGVQQDIAVPVDPAACAAPGYAWDYHGAHSGFTGWTGKTPQDGWTVTDNAGSGQTWAFAPVPEGVAYDFGNLSPSGDSDYTWMDSSYYGDTNQDTSLVSPVVDLTGLADPVIAFDTVYDWFGTLRPSVDLSTDGGSSWTTVWANQIFNPFGPVGPQHIEIPVPQAAGKTAVQVRFRFISDVGSGWALDNIYLGTRKCGAASGGLLAGVVTDANTGDPLNGATVASPAVSAAAAATSDDPGLPDGFYEGFSPATGSQQWTATYPVTATDGRYAPGKATVDVGADQVTRQDFALTAGRLTVTQDNVSVTEGLGRSGTAQVTFGNSGTAPMRVRLGERATGITTVTGQSTPGSNPGKAASPARAGVKPGSVQVTGEEAPAAPWATIPDLPVTTSQGDIVAYHGGLVYAVGGVHDLGDYLAGGYAYDPYDTGAQQWKPIAPMPRRLGWAAGGFAGDRLYVAGGAYVDDGDVRLSSLVYAYDPVSDRWSQVADLPQAVSHAAAAVLGGQLYIIGGCTNIGQGCDLSASVYRYDPVTNAWARLADYPSPVALQACAGADGEVVCAGGFGHNPGGTFIYHPATNTWTKGADMPYLNAQMAYGAANGKLVIVSGETFSGAIVTGTTRAAAYDPATNAWSALPDVSVGHSVLQGGGGCGFSFVGGYDWFGSAAGPLSKAEMLPGYNQCGSADDVPWLSEDSGEFTLAPGQSVTVTVTMDSSKVSQPGAYDGQLFAMTDSPYPSRPVGTVMRVNPPDSWGGITGAITDAGTGQPLSGPVGGATIQVCSNYDSSGTCGQVKYTLKMGKDGRYQLWLDARYNSLQVIAAADHYVPQVRRVIITPGKPSTVNFTLSRL